MKAPTCAGCLAIVGAPCHGTVRCPECSRPWHAVPAVRDCPGCRLHRIQWSAVTSANDSPMAECSKCQTRVPIEMSPGENRFRPMAPTMVTAATRAHILAALDVVIAGNVEIPGPEAARLDYALKALLRRVYGTSLPAQLSKTG